MGFKKRGYIKDISDNLVRDYKLFAIACEGTKTEPDYFSQFQRLSRRIKIDIIQDVEDEENKSSPKWVLNKAMKYIKKNDLQDIDDLWFVIDVDRWERVQIEELVSYCFDRANWNIVISNPCFEIWKLFHLVADIDESINSCRGAKSQLGEFNKAIDRNAIVLKDVRDAIQNAKNKDANPNYHFPEVRNTKVYQLLEALLAQFSQQELEDNFS